MSAGPIREAIATAIEACLTAGPVPGPTFRAYLSRQGRTRLMRELSADERFVVVESRAVTAATTIRLFDPRWGAIDIDALSQGPDGFVLARMADGSTGYFPIVLPGVLA